MVGDGGSKLGSICQRSLGLMIFALNSSKDVLLSMILLSSKWKVPDPCLFPLWPPGRPVLGLIHLRYSVLVRQSHLPLHQLQAAAPSPAASYPSASTRGYRRRRDISSRSAKLNARADLIRGVGAMPPCAISMFQTETGCLLNSRAISLMVQPSRQRAQ